MKTLTKVDTTNRPRSPESGGFTCTELMLQPGEVVEEPETRALSAPALVALIQAELRAAEEREAERQQVVEATSTEVPSLPLEVVNPSPAAYAAPPATELFPSGRPPPLPMCVAPGPWARVATPSTLDPRRSAVTYVLRRETGVLDFDARRTALYSLFGIAGIIFGVALSAWRPVLATAKSAFSSHAHATR